MRKGHIFNDCYTHMQKGKVNFLMSSKNINSRFIEDIYAYIICVYTLELSYRIYIVYVHT